MVLAGVEGRIKIDEIHGGVHASFRCLRCGRFRRGAEPRAGIGTFFEGALFGSGDGLIDDVGSAADVEAIGVIDSVLMRPMARWVTLMLI